MYEPLNMIHHLNEWLHLHYKPLSLSLFLACVSIIHQCNTSFRFVTCVQEEQKIIPGDPSELDIEHLFHIKCTKCTWTRTTEKERERGADDLAGKDLQKKTLGRTKKDKSSLALVLKSAWVNFSCFDRQFYFSCSTIDPNNFFSPILLASLHCHNYTQETEKETVSMWS